MAAAMGDRRRRPRPAATPAIFSASTIWRISNCINYRSNALGRLVALSTWWFVRECCTTCPIRTTDFALFAMYYGRAARCA